MAGKRKTPKLRNKEGCFIADFYRPDGKRSTISFGGIGERTEGEIYAAFGQWLDLFNRHPHKTLTYESPYDATREMAGTPSIVTVKTLWNKYVQWATQYLFPLRDGRDRAYELAKLQQQARLIRDQHERPADKRR